MADNNIRVGRISSIDYDNGMVKVLYKDRNNAVTDTIPFLNLNGEYKMPNIDDMVLVLHLSNGSSMGIVMGTFWSSANKPAETGAGLYRKEFGTKQNESYMRYKDGTLTIKADNIILDSKLTTVQSMEAKSIKADSIDSSGK